MYGKWADNDWATAPVSIEVDDTYRIRKTRDWSINVHLPLELFDLDDSANKETASAINSDWTGRDINSQPRHTIQTDVDGDYIDDAKPDGWEAQSEHD